MPLVSLLGIVFDPVDGQLGLNQVACLLGQSIDIKRFKNVIRCAGDKASDDQCGIVGTGEHNNVAFGAAVFDVFDNFIPMDSRQNNVEEDQIEMDIGFNCIDPLLRRFDGGNLKILFHNLE